MKRALVLATLTVIGLTAAVAEAGTVNYNDTITAIYGSGNPNNGWVSSTAADGSQLALTADYRATGVVPNNGDGSYSFPTGTDPAHPNRALWNFAYSVYDPLGLAHNSLDYTLTITGPGGVNATFDLANIPDNAYLTTSGVHSGLYATYAGSSTEMQNSENITFAFIGGDPSLAGDYTLDLKQTDIPSGEVQNEVQTTVHVGGSVPDTTSTASLMAGAFFPIAGAAAYRKRKKASAHAA